MIISQIRIKWVKIRVECDDAASFWLVLSHMSVSVILVRHMLRGRRGTGRGCLIYFHYVVSADTRTGAAIAQFFWFPWKTPFLFGGKDRDCWNE